MNQYKFQESDGTIYPLPEFNIAWREKGFEDSLGGTLTLNISGITKQVADYFNINARMPSIPMPTNYYEMLGVNTPTNDSQRFGLRPLEPLHPATNAPAKEDHP